MEKKILIIDHDENYQDNFKELLELEHSDVEVFIETNKKDIIRLLQEQCILKIIFEPLVKFDRIDGAGLKLFNKISEIIDTSKTEIILHTVVYQEKLKEMGFPDDMRYCQKPYCLDKFSKEIFN
jgi:DNA-binding NtrC family response regulator